MIHTLLHTAGGLAFGAIVTGYVLILGVVSKETPQQKEEA